MKAAAPGKMGPVIIQREMAAFMRRIEDRRQRHGQMANRFSFVSWPVPDFHSDSRSQTHPFYCALGVQTEQLMENKHDSSYDLPGEPVSRLARRQPERQSLA